MAEVFKIGRQTNAETEKDLAKKERNSKSSETGGGEEGGGRVGISVYD